MAARKDGIDRLLDVYQAKYGTSTGSPFYVHPAISFDCSDEHGVSVKAKESIPSGTVLLRVPKVERVSLSNIDVTTSGSDGTTVELKRVIKSLQTKFKSVANRPHPELNGARIQDAYRYGDVCLAVVILHDLTLQKPYTQAWPSPQDMKQDYYPLWDTTTTSPNDSAVQTLLKGTYTLYTLEKYWTILKFIFDTIVQPIFMDNHNSNNQNIQTNNDNLIHQFLPADFCDENQSPQENLWDAFLYASSLIRSRSHEGSIPDEPEIIPLIDLINGLPSFCKQHINVDIQLCVTAPERGSIQGSQIITCQDVAQGQELILSYGDIHASACLIRYAYCPPEVVHHPQASLDVLLLRVPGFLAPPDDLRVAACRKSNFPTSPQDIEREFFIMLGYDALSVYKRSPILQGEPEGLLNIRQFLTLSHLLDDELVRLNLDTGRLRSSMVNPRWVGQLHLVVLDHLLTHFTSLNETDTVEAASNEDQDASPSQQQQRQAICNVRKCQRDTMARWRHAICQRYGIPSEHAEPKALYDDFVAGLFSPRLPQPSAPQCLLANNRGCRVCGRIIQLKACSKCKMVKYCGRDHQVMDWNKTGRHKQECASLAKRSRSYRNEKVRSGNEPERVVDNDDCKR